MKAKLKPTAICIAAIAVSIGNAAASAKTFTQKASDFLFAHAARNGMVLGVNALTKQLEVHFEEFIVGFDAACVISQEAQFYYPDQQAMQRAGDTVYRAQDFHMAITSGLDISAATPTDVIQRMVPATYKSPQNVLYAFDAKEMRDPNNMQRTGKAAGLRLAAQIDSDIYTAVAQQAANVITVTGGAVLTWDYGALAEAVLLSKGMPVGSRRKMFLNPFDYKDVAKDLGNRAYLKDETLDAYERSRVPAIAGFETFRTDNLSNLAGIGTVSGTTVSGAQSFTPSAMTGNLPTDNRQMTLVIAGANIANIKNGDCFTIGSGGTAVNAVHNITKDDSGQLQTFRVLSGAGTANIVITPAIVATGPYQNVSQAAGAGAAITFINTVTKPVNAFWVDGAVELMAGKLAFPEGQGAQIMTATSKNGIPLIMSYAFDHLKGKTTCRYTSLYATTVLQPELCGIILAKQT